MTTRVSIRALTAIFLALALVAVGLSLQARAKAEEAAPLPVPPSAVPQPTAQIDGVAWQQVTWGDTVYVGGLFKTARPAGAKAGTNTVPRLNMMAFNINTGELINSFVADTNGQVYGLAMAPDGSKLYLSGEFTKVNGVNRYRIAAVDPVTGAVDMAFKANLDYRVRSVIATNDAVYVAGKFNSANGKPRQNLAAFSPIDGSVLNWAPKAENGQAMALATVPGSDRVTVGGSFSHLNGVKVLGLTAVDRVSGAIYPYPANEVIKNGTDDKSAIYSLYADDKQIYGSGYTFYTKGGLGNLEGTFSTDYKGTLLWMNDGRGDTYDVFARRGMVFTAGHSHRMANVENGFPEVDWSGFPQTTWASLAMTSYQTGVLSPSTASYNFPGKPANTLLHFFPMLSKGTVTGLDQATWTVGGNDKFLVLGGEFPKVAGVAQQGLVRFAFRDVNSTTLRPELSAADFAPDLTSPAAGVAQVSWKSNWDRDDAVLTYTVEREGAGAVATYRGRSTYYERPIFTHLDEGLTAGATYRYRIAARDSSGNVNRGDWASVTVRDAETLSHYTRTILDDRPQTFRRLGEASDAVVDSAYTYNGTVSGGVTRGVPGALVGDGNPAIKFNGGQKASITAEMDTPRAMSSEAWIRTTSAKGGMIVGWGDSATGASGQVDYVTYMGGDGKVRFGVEEKTKKVLTSPTRLNDGKWHHVVASLDWWTGQRLYVDGVLVAQDPATRHARDFSGNWRIGGDSLAGYPGKGSDNFTGEIDEVATYIEALPADRVQAHYVAGTGGTAPKPARLPVAAFDASTSALTATLNARAFDPDGTIAAYQWSFGDGTTAEGAAATRTYTAPGTYEVALTVTDNSGATVTSSQSVTVSAPLVAGVPFLSDDFARMGSLGWGTAPVGGNWTHTGGLSNFWVDGQQANASVPPGTAKRALNGTSVADVDVRTTVSLAAAPTGGGTYLALGARSDGSNAYTVRVRFRPDGLVTLYVRQVVGGVATTIGTADLAGLTYVPGQALNIRFMVDGAGTTVVQAKAWPASAPEPEAWTVAATDTTPALQVPGTVYVENYGSASSTNTAVLKYDAISVTPLG